VTDHAKDDRHENRGRDARQDQAPKKVRLEHIVAGILSAVLAAGQAKTITSSSDLAGKIDAQGSTLTSLQLSLAEIKANGVASDKVVDRLSSDLASVVRELRDLRDGSVRGSAKHEDLERRVGILEGKK
jgi:hypothetical protein